MTSHFRSIAGVVLAGAAMTGLVLAQGQAPAPPAGQPAAGQAPPPGRGAGRGTQAPPAGRGQRRGGFTQYTRELAPQDVLVRGQSLYEANCASCHAADLRGTPSGTPNLLRSGLVFNDKHGELVAGAVSKHAPALTLSNADVVAIAEYFHSVQATMGGQGSPPGRNPTNVTLNVLVGDAKAGETEFSVRCSGCHSGSNRPLTGIGNKYPDPRNLQNAWFVGSGALGAGGGRGGGGGAGNAATVTLADGSKVEGTLVRADDFLVIVNLADGTRKSFARNNGVPKVEVKDPREAHKGMAMKLIFEDPDNKKMHDLTAYLATMK